MNVLFESEGSEDKKENMNEKRYRSDFEWWHVMMFGQGEYVYAVEYVKMCVTEFQICFKISFEIKHVYFRKYLA